MSETAFFQDLMLLMVVAGVVSAVFSRLRWPKAIGYIIAGVLLSRHTWGVSFLADEGSVQTIGRLGIVFLMFTMGLEFSFSDMKRIKNVTFPTAILDTTIMVWVGYTVGRNFLHWDTVPSLFLGAAICDSSTTLLAKIIDEMKWSSRPFAKYVVGTSVCEDILCVIVIAVVTGITGDGRASLGAIGAKFGGLAMFFLATIVFGLVLVPRLLTSVARRGDDEMLLVTLLGCCFLVTFVAFKLDYSLALGAFLVGILGSGSEVRRRLHQLVGPLRSMFSAVFFVSIGLLVNPASCWSHLPAILAISAVVMAGKGLNCFAGGVASGESLKTSLQMGFSLAQIGEFGYMVAMLYITTTGDQTTHMYQIVVGVSLLTTILNPLMIRASDPAGEWLERSCPARLRRLHDTYRGFIAKYRSAGEGSSSRRAVRSALISLLVIGALGFSVAIGFSILNGHDWSSYSVLFDKYKRFVSCIAVNTFMLAMLWPVVRLSRALADAIAETVVGRGDARWQLAVRHVVWLVVQIAAVGLFFLETVMVNVNLAPGGLSAWLAIAGVMLVVAACGWKFFSTAAHRAAVRFGEALRTDERLAALSDEVRHSVLDDAVKGFCIAGGSPAVGATVVTLDIRAKTGASVVGVERGGERIANVGPGFEFREGDVLLAIGEGAQLAALKDLLGITS